jgi:hypothetical protein
VITTPAGLNYHVDPEIIGPVADAPHHADPPNRDPSGNDPPEVWDEELDDPPPF